MKPRMTTLEFLSQDKEVRRLYEMRQKALLDERSAMDKARREGKTEGKEEVAINLLADGMDILKVAKLTGLSETEIGKLRRH